MSIPVSEKQVSLAKTILLPIGNNLILCGHHIFSRFIYIVQYEHGRYRLPDKYLSENISA